MDVPGLSVPFAATDPDEGRMEALRRAAPGSGTKAAAQELEVLFLTQLLRAMRKTVPENDFLPASPARNVLDGAFDRAVAASMAERDPLGLVERLGGQDGLKSQGGSAETATGQQQKGVGQ
jgi:Rod binding domain-containing protein